MNYWNSELDGGYMPSPGQLETFNKTNEYLAQHVAIVSSSVDGSRQTYNFKREDLARIFAELGFKRGAEIGVARGFFSEILCRCIPDLELICVDPWMSYGGNPRGRETPQQEQCMRDAQEKLKGFNAKLIRKMSMDAIKDVPDSSLDFVYIDGNHCFDYVMQDLIEWGKKVRIGGIISGDDFYEFRWAGVVTAVEAYVKAHGVTMWYLTCDTSRTKRDRPTPSFFWAKLY